MHHNLCLLRFTHSKFSDNLFKGRSRIIGSGFYLYSMKAIITVLLFTLFARVAFAQKDLLSFDEHDKYIYYQVADAPGMAADTLHAQMLYFLKATYPKIKVKTKATGSIDIEGQGKFLTYSSILVLKHENGEVNFMLNMEFKDQKFRYWITGFVYTPYERDRYGNFIPKAGIEIPLEIADKKLDKREVENHLNETGAFCKQFTDNLKLFMLKPKIAKKEEPTKKIVVDKW